MSAPAVWLLMISLVFGSAESREGRHIQWNFSSIKQSSSEWKLVFTATIDRGWHLYSQLLDEGGPMPTEIAFDGSDDYRLLGKAIEEGDRVKAYDSTFMMGVVWYEGKAVFTQRVRARSKVDVKGEIRYSVCSEDVCVPGTVRFSLTVGN